MKLVRINHIRCDEQRGTTFVWVDDDMTEQQLEQAVARAMDAYLGAATAFMETDKPDDAYSINWKAHGDRKVSDVLAEHEEKRKQRDDWMKKRSAAIRGFDEFLEKEEGICGFWSVEADIEADADWGHRHGTEIKMGETKWRNFKLVETKSVRKPTGGNVVLVEDEDDWAA